MDSAMDVPIMNTNLVEEGTKWALVLHLIKDLLREQMELYYFYFFYSLFDFPFLYNFKAPFSPVTTLKKTPFISCAHSTM